MINYKITISNGLQSTIDAESEADLYGKIDTGHYAILPIRGKRAITITRQNISSIEETDKQERLTV